MYEKKYLKNLEKNYKKITKIQKKNRKTTKNS